MTGIFVSLPVEDVPRATAFYAAIGFAKDDGFSSPNASAMRWSAAVSVMLLDRATFATLTTKRIADARAETTALLALSFDSRDAVDAIAGAALAAGGRELHAAEDLGFMYSRAFEDPDGHGWGPFWMAAAEGGIAAGERDNA